MDVEGEAKKKTRKRFRNIKMHRVEPTLTLTQLRAFAKRENSPKRPSTYSYAKCCKAVSIKTN